MPGTSLTIRSAIASSSESSTASRGSSPSRARASTAELAAQHRRGDEQVAASLRELPHPLDDHRPHAGRDGHVGAGLADASSVAEEMHDLDHEQRIALGARRGSRGPGATPARCPWSADVLGDLRLVEAGERDLAGQRLARRARRAPRSADPGATGRRRGTRTPRAADCRRSRARRSAAAAARARRPRAGRRAPARADAVPPRCAGRRSRPRRGGSGPRRTRPPPAREATVRARAARAGAGPGPPPRRRAAPAATSGSVSRT